MSKALQYYHEKIKNNPEYMEYRRLKKKEWYLNNKQYVSDYYKVYSKVNDEKIKLNQMVWRLSNSACDRG